MFPIIPVPNFLVEMFPMLGEMHAGFAWAGAVGFAFFGLFILMLWVPSYNDMKETARSRIQMGVGLLVLAIVSLMTGFYIWALMIIGIFVFMLWALVRGIIIAFKG